MVFPPPSRLSHPHILIDGKARSAHPLLLLHGSGGSEQDLVPFAAACAADTPALSIRGAEPWEAGFAFFRRFENRSIDEDNLAANAASLACFIEAAGAAYRFARLPVAIGFSNGAIMSAALLLTHPGLLAGAILFRPLSPFARPVTQPLNGVQVLTIDGAHDNRRTPADGHRMATDLKHAGADVEHHVLPTGHAIATEDRTLAQNWLHRFR